jgi:hypothetical protein
LRNILKRIKLVLWYLQIIGIVLIICIPKKLWGGFLYMTSKKTVSFAMTLAVGIFLAAPVYSSTFSDVDSAAGYSNSVERLYALGLVKGNDKGAYEPERTLNRATAVIKSQKQPLVMWGKVIGHQEIFKKLLS